MEVCATINHHIPGWRDVSVAGGLTNIQIAETLLESIKLIVWYNIMTAAGAITTLAGLRGVSVTGACVPSLFVSKKM